MHEQLLKLENPHDYFSGLGRNEQPTPRNILLFIRTAKMALQQEALQNRSHHRFVLVLNLETKGYVHINHLTFSLCPGQALLIHPYQFHHYSHLSSSRLKWLFCTFELQPQAFLEPLRNRIIDISKKPLSLYDLLLTEWNEPRNEFQAAQLQAVLLQLLISLKQDQARSSLDLPAEESDNILRTINRLLAEHSGPPVVVADLARKMSYSESHLRVLFKEAAGIALGTYIQNYRINHAMALLRTTDLSVADVAEEAGFGSPQAFSRIFRTKLGMTPRAYRSQ